MASVGIAVQVLMNPSELPSAAKPKLRWNQFSLRSLLIVVTVSSVLMGVILWIKHALPPYSLDTRIAFFKRNQAEFNAYVQRIRDGKVGSVDSEYAIPRFMINHDVKCVAKSDDCIVMNFWFMPTDEVPELIYSPRGLAGVPDVYRNGGPKGGKWAYWKFVPIDDKWFYCEWDM